MLGWQANIVPAGLFHVTSGAQCMLSPSARWASRLRQIFLAVISTMTKRNMWNHTLDFSLWLVQLALLNNLEPLGLQ